MPLRIVSARARYLASRTTNRFISPAGFAKRAEPPAGRLLADDQMRVEIDDLIDHAREQLAAGLARIGAHVQPPDPSERSSAASNSARTSPA